MSLSTFLQMSKSDFGPVPRSCGGGARSVRARPLPSRLTYPRRPEVVQAFITTPPAWLEIHPPASIEPIARLDAGEIAAIALARELRADRVIIDEAGGRKAAVERKLEVIGTIGILVYAKKMN